MNWTEIVIGGLIGWALGDLLSVFEWAALRIVPVAARLWTTDPDRREIYSEEWAALVAERPGGILKLMTAAGFVLAGLSRRLGRQSVATLGSVEAELLRNLFIGLVNAYHPSSRAAHPATRALRFCGRYFSRSALLPVVVILRCAFECLAVRDQGSVRRLVRKDLVLLRSIARIAFSRRGARAAAEVLLGARPT
ncbi:hypothetical protein OHA72_15555 [Dactylosporangium sp. NBC_01737]|uniref:hypothetical protein n=1 Tax=Dactylosporangium sp. NBC_01737 TaxID=2975959 RepID=UPI002E0DF944|nr:hypothetical protein OHA72_15555 [Dactylosporangium sp. NBC_01737]